MKARYNEVSFRLRARPKLTFRLRWDGQHYFVVGDEGFYYEKEWVNLNFKNSLWIIVNKDRIERMCK